VGWLLLPYQTTAVARHLHVKIRRISPSPAQEKTTVALAYWHIAQAYSNLGLWVVGPLSLLSALGGRIRGLFRPTVSCDSRPGFAHQRERHPSGSTQQRNASLSYHSVWRDSFLRHSGPRASALLVVLDERSLCQVDARRTCNGSQGNCASCRRRMVLTGTPDATFARGPLDAVYVPMASEALWEVRQSTRFAVGSQQMWSLDSSDTT